MTGKGLLTLLAVGMLSACSRPTPEQQIANDAAEELGGGDRILAVRTLVIEGEGTQGNLGQDVSPAANGQTFTVNNYRRVIDVVGGRARTELTRTPQFRFFQGQAPARLVNGIDGALGYKGLSDNNWLVWLVNDTVTNDRRLELLHHPLTAVRAALDPTATLANPRTEAGESLVDVTTADGPKFTLAIDTTTKLPTRVVMAGNNDVLGDVALETRFADYRDVSGLQLPARLTSATDDFVTAAIRVATQTVDGDTGSLGRSPTSPRLARCGRTSRSPTSSTSTITSTLWEGCGQRSPKD